MRVVIRLEAFSTCCSVWTEVRKVLKTKTGTGGLADGLGLSVTTYNHDRSFLPEEKIDS